MAWYWIVILTVVGVQMINFIYNGISKGDPNEIFYCFIPYYLLIAILSPVALIVGIYRKKHPKRYPNTIYYNKEK